MEVPEELAAGGKPSSAGTSATSEQAAPSAGQKEPTTMEAVTEPRASKQVAPEVPNIDHAAPEESQVLESGQEALEQSGATPSTQEGGLPDAVARGKGPVVVLRLESSQRQEETAAGEQQEEARTAYVAESEDDDILEEIEGRPKDSHQHMYVYR
jgi:hypothetical protein